MKLLITGAKGQLGNELCRQLAAGRGALGLLPAALAGAAVVPVDIEDCDLTDLSATGELVKGNRPDVVINCAAYTNVDGAEKNRDAAFAVNALAARNLAMACETAEAKLIHLSTDYVFSGEGNEPFSEWDATGPRSVYGATKLLGEEYVRQFCGRWFIVRTAWLYGRQGNNFVKTMLRLASQREELTVVNDQRGNPTNAEDLAHHLLKLAVTEEYGLYHCTGGGVCSWYDFTVEIMRLAGKSTRVRPCTTAEYAKMVPGQAWRPAWSALGHAMLRATVGDEMRPWQDALAQTMGELED